MEGDWSGVVVNDQGDVLTSSEVLAAGRRVTVVMTGEEEEREAAEQWRDDGAGLGLVRVERLEGTGLVVSEAGLAPGAKVFAVMPGEGTGGVEVVEGTVGVVGIRPVEGDAGVEVRFVQHDAMVTARGYGSPLVNECGQVVGLNVPDPKKEQGRLQREKRPKRDAVFAFGAQELVSRLGAREVAIVTVAEACIPPEAPAEEPAAEPPAEEPAAEPPAEEPAAEPPAEEPAAEPPAEEPAAEAPAEEPAAEEVEARAREAEARAREAEARVAEEQRRREEAERQRNEKQEEAQVFEQAVDEATRRMEEQKRFALWGGAGGAALLLLLSLFWVLSAQRKRQAIRTAQVRATEAEQEAAEARRREAPAPAPFDCVLTGRDGGGAAIALNLRRDALVASGGAVIGRDPARSSHVVVDPSMSRAHARVYVRDEVLHVEDLGSTNGTFLNGSRLVEGQGELAYDGDELVLGALTLRVELRE